MPRVHFKPVIINKRKWRAPWFPSYMTGSNGRDDYERLPYDIEKNDNSDWEDATNASSSANSSRVSSASYDSQETLLDRRKKPRKPAKAYAPLRQCNLYFTVILGTVLVVFVLILFTLHKRSAAEVSSGVHKPEPKPPPWTEFPKLERYWGGLRSLVNQEQWDPEYPTAPQQIQREVIEALHEDEDTIRRRSMSNKSEENLESERPVECFIEAETPIKLPRMQSYDGVPQGFPKPVIGVQDFDLRNETQCQDRYGRLGPYGFGYRSSEGGIGAGVLGDDGERDSLDGYQSRVDYSSVSWHRAQEACATANAHRFKRSDRSTSSNVPQESSSRTAVLIRTDSEHHYSLEELLRLRAMVAEAALATGSEFNIHFLIYLNEDLPEVWSNTDLYEETANEALPVEFHGMGYLWSRQRMEMIYDALAPTDDPIYGPSQVSYLPVQEFARSHAEYDHYWTWDLDTRYTGHIGSLFQSLNDWTIQQPRKELWERNARFYIPEEHGSWDEFSHMVHVLAEHGPPDPFADRSTDGLVSSKPILGPQPPPDNSNPSLFIDPPPSPSDSSTWGVSEAADLISLSPIFDPTHVSSFPAASDFRGYNTSLSLPPRRATTTNVLRLSRRLLLSMHAETLQRYRHMSPEMWPASIALHHGYKAVFAPHRLYVDRKWPLDYLTAVMNTGADGGVVSGRSSVFGESQRSVFEGLSWGSSTGQKSFGRTLWRRWLGYRDEATGDGGEEWEEAGEGRMCLPPMLLGGVGHIDLVVEDDD